jgi:hypothetical protein
MRKLAGKGHRHGAQSLTAKECDWRQLFLPISDN